MIKSQMLYRLSYGLALSVWRLAGSVAAVQRPGRKGLEDPQGATGWADT